MGARKWYGSVAMQGGLCVGVCAVYEAVCAHVTEGLTGGCRSEGFEGYICCAVMLHY